MGLTNVILGLLLLVFGRKLFWLFIAIAGFLVGMEISGVFLAGQPQWIWILVALCAGLAGGLLALLLGRVAFALAGFFAGAYLAVIVAQSLGAAVGSTIIFFAGGLIGAVFAVLITDWAIIILSCLVGAGAIVEALGLTRMISAIVCTALVIAGAIVQARLMAGSKAR